VVVGSWKCNKFIYCLVLRRTISLKVINIAGQAIWCTVRSRVQYNQSHVDWSETVSTALSSWLTASSCLDILKLVEQLLSIMKPPALSSCSPEPAISFYAVTSQFLTQHFHHIRYNTESLPASKFPQLGSFLWGMRLIFRSISHDHAQCVTAMVMSVDTIFTCSILRPIIFTQLHLAWRHRSILQRPFTSCARSIVLYTQRFNIRTLLQIKTNSTSSRL